MAMVDVDGSSHLSADSQPKLVGLVRGLAATWRSVCIHQMNWVNSHSDHGHEDSTINIVIELLLLLLLTTICQVFCLKGEKEMQVNHVSVFMCVNSIAYSVDIFMETIRKNIHCYV